jgi:hypothetical protein
MAGVKKSGWRSRFSKKDVAVDDDMGQVNYLAEPFDIDKERKINSLRPSRGSKMTSLMGLDDEHLSRQHRVTNEGRFNAVMDIPDIRPNTAKMTASPDLFLREHSPGYRGLTRLDRGYAESSRSNSEASSNTKHSFVDIDVDETSCPVCLELLSFRLAGEKPHVTPACGHALHHACFTAVYGSPEALLASQNAPGRAAPGMCGVCRAMISLGDEGETRRQNSEFPLVSSTKSWVVFVGVEQTEGVITPGQRVRDRGRIAL